MTASVPVGQALAQAREIEALRAEVERLRGREAHFAKRLGIPDGGQYRNDWDARLTALLADVKALAEALEWALDMLAINDQLILEKLPEAWKSLNQDIDVAAKRRAHAALSRDGVRRGRGEEKG